MKYDKQVLKFIGYFSEHVVESAYENYRYRKCNIYYYLEDDTIHINEIKEENSGIVQSLFVRRQRCLNNYNNQPITWRDFKLNSDIFLFGKKFRLCECDKFTLNFYAKKGISLGEFEPIPEIVSEYKFKDLNKEERLKNIAELKEFIEVGLKGGHPNGNLKQFLENDRKVLNFDISWYDDKYDKEEKRYKMNYYLADGKIEVAEIKVNNSGKDPFPLLLRKMKLPKIPHFSYCPGLETKEETYYEPKDLICGNYVYVYGRKCHILDCDEFTKNWYKENLGIDMKPIKQEKSRIKILDIPKKDSNFDQGEDSIPCYYYLDKKGIPHENYTESFKRDKHILRFNAKMISPIPTDEERKFILSYYLKDESIMIFEIADKNSGRQSCKFLERKRMKNPHTGKFYKENDLGVGTTVYLNKYTFKLLDCDEYTKKYMEDNAELFRENDITQVLKRIIVNSCNFNSIDDYLITLLKYVDPDKKEWVSENKIDEGLKKMNLYLSSVELRTLTNHIKVNENGEYSMEDFFNLVGGNKKY